MGGAATRGPKARGGAGAAERGVGQVRSKKMGKHKKTKRSGSKLGKLVRCWVH